jgi:hypothetical protein
LEVTTGEEEVSELGGRAQPVKKLLEPNKTLAARKIEKAVYPDCLIDKLKLKRTHSSKQMIGPNEAELLYVIYILGPE